MALSSLSAGTSNSSWTRELERGVFLVCIAGRL
jgi:hypothetical protein